MVCGAFFTVLMTFLIVCDAFLTVLETFFGGFGIFLVAVPLAAIFIQDALHRLRIGWISWRMIP